MATDEAKKENTIRRLKLMVQVMTTQIYDILGESSMALAGGMGEAMLAMFEKEQGLELAGEDPVSVAKEVDRILVDEYGIADEISLVSIETGVADIKCKGCKSTAFCDNIVASGVKIPFICPVMLTCNAALSKIGYKEQFTYERWPDGKGCIFHVKRIGYEKPA
jgi:hypothetical protein